MTIEERIERTLEEAVRPVLRLHGGGIKSERFEAGVYYFCLTGQCAGCPAACLETEELIRDALLRAVPEVQKVVLEAGVSPDLLDQARAILNGRRPGL